jgi:hypothetical protein
MRAKFGFIAILALMLAFASNATAQAAAEGALVHSLGTSIGSTLGRAMGGALNNATGQVTQTLGRQTATPVSRQRLTTVKSANSNNPAQSTSSPVPISGGGSFIVSIQGAGQLTTNCGSAVNKAAPAAKTPTASASDKACSPQPVQDAQTHPSIVNLPAAK